MWLLLLLPFIGLLWVPFYNTDALPALFGFPVLLLVPAAVGADHRVPDLARLP